MCSQRQNRLVVQSLFLMQGIAVHALPLGRVVLVCIVVCDLLQRRHSWVCFRSGVRWQRGYGSLHAVDVI